MLKCSVCSKEYKESSLLWRCTCGGYLVLEEGDPVSLPGSLDSRPFSQWRYREIFPVDEDRNIVSMGEGLTPVVSQKWRNRNVLFKLDYLCPTGSYKDRGISMLVSKLKELGVDHLVEDSSGNAGASMAAYCSRAGISCEIFVPEYTSPGKCVQIEMYGANLKRIKGSREDTTRAAEEASSSRYYASHNWSPYFVHGIKSLAYEIYEQTGNSLPDHIVVPVGQGSLVMGLFQGFSELKRAGRIKDIPSLIAVQSSRCAPLFKAWKEGLSRPVAIKKHETAAEGISSSDPVKGDVVIANVIESGGKFVTVDDPQVWSSLYDLACAGFYVEPTSAVIGAALDEILTDGTVPHSANVMAILTGSGLKATEKILHHCQSEKAPGK
jgi:threonine synthase